MTKIDETAVWEVNSGDDSWHACYKCAYNHVFYTIGYQVGLELGKNFQTEDGRLSISEDVFGEHAECNPVCASCNLKLG